MKNYNRDIIEPMKLISKLVGPGGRYEGKKQTTQFIVGAADESDAEIVKYMFGLYKRLKMNRVYFSAYQKGLGEESIEGEIATAGRQEKQGDIFMREHRLYQVDFLLRKYGFAESDIIFDQRGNLSVGIDPKETWALRHPGFFPVEVNRASRMAFLRVPGLGPVTVRGILERRKRGAIRGIEDIGKITARLEKAKKYLSF